MRLGLLGLVLLLGCATLHIERPDGTTFDAMVFGQSAATACKPGGAVTAGTAEGIAGTVTGECDHVEGGPMSTATAGVWAAAIAAVAAMSTVAIF
jgi:hypothetical protein